jgi:ribosomal protein L3 glutamine methyltransferase
MTDMFYSFKSGEIGARLETVMDYIRWGVSVFQASDVYYGHGTDNAWDEAVALVLQALFLPMDCDPRVMDAKLLDIEKQRVIEWVEKRVTQRMPLPYITGKALFAGLLFQIDQRVLIPRSPIAELIESQFAPYIDMDQTHSVLELCTGSGCIAIALAVYFPHLFITATDLSSAALDVAKQNVIAHEVHERVELVKTDLFPVDSQQYDLIVANPPYVAKKEWAALPGEYHNEPALALVAGEEGLDIVDRILKEAKRFLSPHGILICEVGATQETVASVYPELPFIWLNFEKSEDGVFLLHAKDLL